MQDNLQQKINTITRKIQDQHQKIQDAHSFIQDETIRKNYINNLIDRIEKLQLYLDFLNNQK